MPGWFRCTRYDVHILNEQIPNLPSQSILTGIAGLRLLCWEPPMDVSKVYLVLLLGHGYCISESAYSRINDASKQCTMGLYFYPGVAAVGKGRELDRPPVRAQPFTGDAH